MEATMQSSSTTSTCSRRNRGRVGACVLLLLGVVAACGEPNDPSTLNADDGAAPPVASPPLTLVEPGATVGGTLPDMRGTSGWSEIPCAEHEFVLEREFPPGDGKMLGLSEVVVRVASINVIGANRYDHSDDEIDRPDEPFVCQSLLRLEVTDVLYEDYTDNIFGGDFPALPEPPFTITASDQFGLVSVERGFADVQARSDELVVGVRRTRDDALAPDRQGAFTLVLLATADASEVFNPDLAQAQLDSARFREIRDRLGVAAAVDLVRAYRSDEDRRMWREMFADLYPSVEEASEAAPSWRELDPSERWLGYDPAYDDGVPDEELDSFEAIGLDIRIGYVGFDDVADFGGVVAVVSDAGRSHSFGLSLAVESHVVPSLRLPGEELKLMLSESPMVDSDGELEIGRVTGVRPGQVAVIEIEATPGGEVRVVSVTERPPTDAELQAAAAYGIQPDGSIDPTKRTVTSG
jgi:hypothetical protein